MTARIFLPARRDDQVLVFEHREQPNQRRWEFVAVACGAPDEPLQRTGNGSLTQEEMGTCQRLVELLPKFEHRLQDNRLTDITASAMGLDMDAELAFVEGSPVLTLALYFHLKRDALVAETSLNRYLGRSPEDRFDLGLTASIYVAMLKAHNLRGASEMIDADMAVADQMPKSSSEWGYFFNQAALLKKRTGHPADAISLYRKALDRWPSASTWRQVGNAHADLDQNDLALEAFLSADAIEPLVGIDAMRTARWLADAGRGEEARKFAVTAAEGGIQNARTLLQKLEQSDG